MLVLNSDHIHSEYLLDLVENYCNYVILYHKLQ